MEAIVLFNPNKNSIYSISLYPLEGYILFQQENKEEPVRINIYLNGLPDGFHGFHIHEKGVSDVNLNIDVEGCCNKLGGHFNVGDSWSLKNLKGTKHPYHTGDLCHNIEVVNGFVEYKFEDNKISLYNDDIRNIIGRSIVIHSDEDDLGRANYVEGENNVESYISGNSGKRIACGEIVKSKKKI